jgi:hypothetical protein
MGRYGLAWLLGLALLTGCASPRVLGEDAGPQSRPTEVAGDLNPFEVEFARPLAITPVRDEIGLPPAPAGDHLAMYDEAADEAADEAPTAPAVPEEPSELRVDDVSDTRAAASDPCVDFPDPCAVRRRAPCCPPPCAPKTCPCGKRAAGQCDCGKAGCGKRACCQKCPCPDPCGNPCGGYVGGHLAFGPGAGGGIEFGINFARNKTALWSWEFMAGYQDFYDEIAGGDDANSGKMRQFRVGVRARFLPCCKWHPTVRAGIGWVNATGSPRDLELAEIDGEGDYLGGYLGVGLEYDLSPRWSTGPEIAVFGGFDAGDTSSTAVVPTLFWHINYRF